MRCRAWGGLYRSVRSHFRIADNARMELLEGTRLTRFGHLVAVDGALTVTISLMTLVVVAPATLTLTAISSETTLPWRFPFQVITPSSKPLLTNCSRLCHSSQVWSGADRRGE